MGGEDMSFFRLCLVAFLLGLQTQPKFSLSPPPSHFDFDETALEMGRDICSLC